MVSESVEAGHPGIINVDKYFFQRNQNISTSETEKDCEETWAVVRLLTLAVAPPANSSRRQVVHLQVQVVHLEVQVVHLQVQVVHIGSPNHSQ